MTRRTRLNTALAVITVALAAWLWLSRFKPPAPPPQPLLHIARQDINRIEIQPADSKAVVLTRKQGHWQLLQPVHARANASTVKNLLAIATIAPKQRYAADDISPTETGLKEPTVKLEFNNGPTLAIGTSLPLNSGPSKRYVRSGATVALAAIAHAGVLDMQWTQWIDPHVLTGNAQLETLHLPESTLNRSATGGWRVSPASRDRGADAAQFTVNAWRHATALNITPAQNRPALDSIQLVFVDGHTRRLDVITRQPQLILRDPQLDIAYHLASDMNAALLNMQHSTPDNLGADSGGARQRPTRNGRHTDQRSR